MLDWLNLSANIYLISRDKELREKVIEFAGKIKNAAGENISEKNIDGVKSMYGKIRERVKEVREDVGDNFEEMLKHLYDKIHLVHEDRLRKMEDQINEMKREMALTEAKLVALERNHRKY